MRWPFTTYGTTTLLACLAVCGLLAVGLGLLFAPLAWLALAPALFVLNFFRDPDRKAEGGEDQLVSPADGMVADIVTLIDPALNVPCTRIGIFLNVFDVHVNRIPVGGRVTKLSYRKGKFVNASLDKASVDNERMAIRIEAEDGGAVALVQIAGLVARRIVCHLREGEQVTAGQRFGLIRFGSRTDVYLPPGWVPLVVAGQRAVGGETVIADRRAQEPPRQGFVQ
jgi:phosphatidylserine decarboxylase